MRCTLQFSSLLLSLSLILTGCSTFGGGDNDSSSNDKQEKKKEQDPDKARVQAARDAWPAYTGDLKDLIDLSDYSVVSLIPFENLTDNSQEEEAGEALVDEIQDYLEDRYENVFTSIRIADTPLGQADEIVLRGQVYDFSSSHYSYWAGRTKAKFKAEMVLANGQSGDVLKSARIKADSRYDSREEMIEDAAKDVAKLLARSKTKGSE